jgi:hypothetical protein
MAELKPQQNISTPDHERRAGAEEQHQQEIGLLMLGLGQSAALPVHPTARGLRQSYALSIQRSLGNAHFQRTLTSAHQSWHQLAQAPPVPSLIQPAIFRSPEMRHVTGPLHELMIDVAILKVIQQQPMPILLGSLPFLPEKTRTNELAGNIAGGSRMVTAMHAIRAKGKPWLEFAAAHNGELAALPDDQIGDIMQYLGAPKDARYFKANEFDGRFDGAVDPASGTITLFFRVKFDVHAAQFGTASQGTPEWEQESKKGLQKFGEDFKRVVEEQWSGKGNVKPPRVIGKNKSFQTKVVVTVVESGEHKLVRILSDTAEGRSRTGKVGEAGTWKVSDNLPKKEEDKQLIDPAGHKQVATNQQATSAHEFGHAIGLDHVRCQDPNNDNCYGVTPEERRDIMGAGDQLQVIKRAGKVLHDDFLPFERIGERWSKYLLPGALAKSNKWSAG